MPPTIRYRVPLTCAHCGTLNDAPAINLYSSGLGNDPIDTSVVPAQVLELELADFEDAFHVLRTPADDEPTFTAVEIWGCVSCHRLRAACLTFRRRTRHIVEFVSANECSLSKEVLDAASFVTRRIDEWAVQPGDDAERIAALLRDLG